MKTLSAFLHRPEATWVLLCLPALPMIAALFGDNPRILHILVHPSGEWAARFLILALMATPLMRLLPGWRGPRWLGRSRRYLGVAAFGYTVAHLTLYLADRGLARAWEEAFRFLLATGWLGFLVMVPLAATSTDAMVRRMGPAWKSLQRWTYAAAILTLLHWASLHGWGGTLPALLHFTPLILVSAWRIWRWNLPFARQTA